MCAIFGTSKKEEIKLLYDKNHDRGGFALGSLYITLSDQFAIKKLPTKDYIGSIDYTFCPEYTKYSLFHDQAPTSSVRTFSIETSHPFQYSEWVVAHNGVLTDYEQLLPEHDHPVDSSYIPILLHKESGDEITRIENVCNKLNGTFACWIYNTRINRIFLVKQGSTLFYKGNSFSSVMLDSWESLKDGVVYEIKDQIEEVGKFTDKNPFALLI